MVVKKRNVQKHLDNTTSVVLYFNHSVGKECPKGNVLNPATKRCNKIKTSKKQKR